MRARGIKFFLLLVVSLIAVSIQSMDKKQIEWKTGCDSTFVFQITDKEAFRYLQGKEIADSLLYKHVATFKDVWADAPEKGHFIYATISKNKVYFNYECIVPFQVFLFKEYGIFSLQVVDSEGNIRNDAKVRIQNGKWRFFDITVPYDKDSKIYRIEDTPDKVSRILTVELDKHKMLLELKKNIVQPEYNYPYGNKAKGPDFYSYMITDKNKYKPGEKVRFKSYALSGNKKPIKEKLSVYLSSKKIAEIEPYNPGGFAGEIEIHDSLNLVLDRTYYLSLKDQKGRTISTTHFKYEDYELFDTHLESTLKNLTQYNPDNNELEIKVLDANDLIISDLKVIIDISMTDVSRSYNDLLIMPYHLKRDTIVLDRDKPTKYQIPPRLFGDTDCRYSISLSTMTLDGRELSQSHSADFYKSKYELKLDQQDSILNVTFFDAGKTKSIRANLKIDNKKVQYIDLPGKITIDPFAQNYVITIPEYNLVSSRYVSSLNSGINATGGFSKGNLNIELSNPLDIECTWFVYEGGILLEKGSGKTIEFEKKDVEFNTNYFLEVFYTFGGEDEIYRKVFSPKLDILNIDWNMPTRVYPGQTIDNKIKVTDSYGRGVKNVDLTAMSSNSQLNYYLPDLPYYGNTPKGREQRDSYEINALYASSSSVITSASFEFWNGIAHLHTYPYYRFIYPHPQLWMHDVAWFSSTIDYQNLSTFTIDTPDKTTEFAPFVMKNGEPQKIQVIELDSKPVYFSWSEQPQHYSFLTESQKYHTVSLRTSDRTYTIQNLCFIEGKKTIISLDTDSIPSGIYGSYSGNQVSGSESYKWREYLSMIPTNDRFTYMESLMSDSTAVNPIPIYYPNYYRNSNRNRNSGYVIVGPLKPGGYKYMDGIPYLHEGGYKYKYAYPVIYKYQANCFPTFRTEGAIGYEALNEFSLTPALFKREIGLTNDKQDPWYPEVLTLPNAKFHICRDQEESGLRGLIFINDETKKLYAPIFNRNYLNTGSKTLFNMPNMDYGNYDVIVLYENGNYLKTKNIPFKQETYVEMKFDNSNEIVADSISEKWLKYKPVVTSVNSSYDSSYNSWTPNIRNSGQYYNSSMSFNPANDVKGIVMDESGDPLIGVSIIVKGTNIGTISDIDGRFVLDLHGANNQLEFMYLGYTSQTVDAVRGASLEIKLKEENMLLDEVVVVGYGTRQRSMITGSMSSVSSNNEPSQSFKEEAIEEAIEDPETSDTSDEASKKMYQDLLLLDGMRSNFSDVGFWEPRLVTNRKGEVEFQTTFPDNITRWNAVVYAMNRKLKTGTLRRSINSYKPIMAEIKNPDFIVVGDSIDIPTSIRNYTGDSEIKGQVYFTLQGDTLLHKNVVLDGSFVDQMPLTSPLADSLSMSYRFTRNDGYSDGEMRKIPINPLGTEIAVGNLEFMKEGELINVEAKENEKVYLTVTGSQLDIYMGVTRDLINYKYACNEQLASKLIGLVYNKIYAQLVNKPFEYDKEVNEIINKLLRNQNTSHQWSWWGNSSYSSSWMSSHIYRALKLAKDAGYTVALDKDKLKEAFFNLYSFSENLGMIDIINTLVDWGVDMDYESVIDYYFDLIAKQEERERKEVEKRKKEKKSYYGIRNSYFQYKLLLTEMQQKLKMPIDTIIITDNIRKGVLGSIYVEDKLRLEDDFSRYRYWYYNNDANNIVAYRIVRNDSILADKYKEGMQMHILDSKKKGWNTYQASKAVMTILPDLISNIKDSTQLDQTLRVTGKVNKVVTDFPFTLELDPKEYVILEKTSSLPLIYSDYTWKYRTEEHIGDAFAIETKMSQPSFVKGSEVKMDISLEVKEDNAEYVMIEIPIPAGCSYADKSPSYSYYTKETHREYFKDRVVIFCEKMPRGKYSYTINLLPRYSGKFTINPAKAELMYFPVVNGNNAIKQVVITE